MSEAATDILHPLTALYTAAGRELPRFEMLPADMLPAVPRQLLAHSGDMTSKLEEHFTDAIVLRVLQREHTPQHYRREVVLCAAKTGLPVEYGAIEIQLDSFDPAIRGEIIEARLPLGGLLNRHQVRYRSEPRGFFRVLPCALLIEIFGAGADAPLYGRSNQLVGADGGTLARIVEILCPV